MWHRKGPLSLCTGTTLCNVQCVVFTRLAAEPPESDLFSYLVCKVSISGKKTGCIMFLGARAVYRAAKLALRHH